MATNYKKQSLCWYRARHKPAQRIHTFNTEIKVNACIQLYDLPWIVEGGQTISVCWKGSVWLHSPAGRVGIGTLC